MNERIKQLAEQAGFDLIQHGDHVIYDISTKENMSEFARLIVQECVSICEDHPAWTGRMIGNQIGQHFGVK